MKTLQNLLFIFIFTMLAGGMAHSAEGEKSAQHKGQRQNDFYPKQPADKRLSDRPGQVELLEPKALSQVSGTQVTLKWKPTPNAESYRVQVATDPNFKWLMLQKDFYQNTSLDVPRLESGKKYFWRVYAWKPGNDSGYTSSFSSMSSFEVK